MASTPAILSLDGKELKTALPKAAGVRPFGSKILVEILRANEIMGSSIHIDDNTMVDGAPQAYIVALGPNIGTDSGLAVGQRIYWTGKGTQIDNPTCTNGRVNALLEINNILAIIDEAK